MPRGTESVFTSSKSLSGRNVQVVPVCRLAKACVSRQRKGEELDSMPAAMQKELHKFVEKVVGMNYRISVSSLRRKERG